MSQSPVIFSWCSNILSPELRFSLLFVDGLSTCMIRAPNMRNPVVSVIVVVFAATLIAARMHAQRNSDPVIPIAENDIGGVVTGATGPEAGVWVIAETTDLPTPFIKIVVTDDSGRYLIPDLPKANYKVWVRGYGLVDSKPQDSAPGKTVNLTAAI